MRRVLVLDADPTLTSAVARCLREAGLFVEQWSRAPEHPHEAQFDVALVEWRFVGAADGLGANRVVVMLSYADPETERDISRRFAVIRKPFTSVELVGLLNHELGMLTLRPRRLVDALRAAHFERRSLRIVPETSDSVAVVHVARGEVVDARYGILRGEDALCALLRTPMAVHEEPTAVIERRTVMRPFRELLFDLLARIDDDERSEREGAVR